MNWVQMFENIDPARIYNTILNYMYIEESFKKEKSYSRNIVSIFTLFTMKQNTCSKLIQDFSNTIPLPLPGVVRLMDPSPLPDPWNIDLLSRVLSTPLQKRFMWYIWYTQIVSRWEKLQDQYLRYRNVFKWK